MGLAQYHKKRDFSKTGEPRGSQKASGKALHFVVQKHAASSLHYDFRLEIDGVLVSWAVPKGPSNDPAQKRLAVHVEDHPLDYMQFEGNIPQGQYGGGTVMVWDTGTYTPEENPKGKPENTVMKKQLRDRSIKIVLQGKKLQGAWHLVEMQGKENQWLLFKADDDKAGKSKRFGEKSVLSKRTMAEISKTDAVWHSDSKTVSNLTKQKPEKPQNKDLPFSAEALVRAKKMPIFPKNWRPQLATLASAAFDDPDWIFESKFDGYRTLAYIQSGNVRLESRNGLSFNAKFPEISQALSAIGDDLILDGEIIAQDDGGKSHFQWLQDYGENPQGILRYCVFDLIYYNGFDLRGLPLLERKKILKALLRENRHIVYAAHVVGSGVKAYEKASQAQTEGIVAKKANAPYQTGKRSGDWLKIKTSQSQEMVVAGFTEPSGSRKGIGALLCGYYQDGKLVYSGKVGSGFSNEMLRDLRGKLERLKRKTCPFAVCPDEKNVHWVTPKLVAALKFSEFTQSGSMRHPVFLGLRSDKAAAKVVLEQAPEKTAKRSPTHTVTPMKSTPPVSKKVTFTNLDKLYFPKLKITKGDVVSYYDRMAAYILPYLKDRPQSLRRNPDGISGDGFFQKNVAGSVPDWIKTRKIKSDSKADSITYMLCQDRDTLLFMANYGCIEVNPWSSRVGSINHPDYIIFDLDPKSAPLQNLIKTAQKLKEILDYLDVPAYLKTSGGNGLHVFIPVLPQYSYEQTRHFSHLISQMVHRELPRETSLERLPEKRQGKVYLDYLQNGRGKTMASIYALRPRETAGVSTPLHWDELPELKKMDKMNYYTIFERLEKVGDLWSGIFEAAIDLKRILKTIE